MTNPENIEYAEFAAKCGVDEQPEAYDLREYSFAYADGSPAGSEFAEDVEEAARIWGEHLALGDVVLLQVSGDMFATTWLKVERTRDGVEARECSV